MPEERPPRPREATALRYEQGQNAPQVVATGRGLIAERIIAEARKAGIPVREEPALAEALARLPLDTEIPPELYTAVAEALAWAYRLDARRATRPR
jgi:flagellar biosynthesis protein